MKWSEWRGVIVPGRGGANAPSQRISLTLVSPCTPTGIGAGKRSRLHRTWCDGSDCDITERRGQSQPNYPQNAKLTGGHAAQRNYCPAQRFVRWSYSNEKTSSAVISSLSRNGIASLSLSSSQFHHINDSSVQTSSSVKRALIGLAGFPATMTQGGTSFVTTESVPITAPLPM